MSEDRLERTHRAIDEFNAGTMGSAFDAFFVADVRFRDELGELDNRADLRAYLESFQEAFGGLHVDVEHAQEIGDTLLLRVNQGGRGTMSGAEVEERFTWLLTFQGEGCVRWQIYAEHAEALEAVRLLEGAMSQENAEVILRAVAAVNRQDADAFVATGSPDVEWEDAMFWSEPLRIWRGRAELREWFKQVILEPWESIHVEVEEIIEAADDRVFYGLFLTARGKGSGVDTELRVWAVNWFADGKVTRRQVFRDRAEALAAAGLQEPPER